MKQRKLAPVMALVVLVFLLQACGGGGDDAPASTSTTSPTPTSVAAQPTEVPDRFVDPSKLPAWTEIDVSNGGTITGVATHQSAPPEQGVIVCTKDCDVFGDTIPQESLIVSGDGKIENVVVFIEEITEGKALSRAMPSITNQLGRFEPHVQTFYAREFLIRSVDPVLHNTHPYLGRKEEGGRSCYNVAIRADEGDAKQIRKNLCAGAVQSGVYQIRCDAHDWMRGWVLLLDHPYGATSGEDGSYVIDQIPPGTYMLKAWHETLGEQVTEITVTAGGTTEVNFEFGL